MKQYLLPMILLAGLLSGCTKNKIENVIPPLSVGSTTSSSIRLYNFCFEALDISVNNNPLTSFSTSLATGGTALGLSLFPTGAWQTGNDGSPFSIPNSLLDKNNMVHIHIVSRGSGVSNASFIIDTILGNNPASPTNYYVLDGTPHVLIVPALNTPPVQTQDVKIRVVNLGAPGDPLNLSGPVTLTYADGTPVSAATSNVPLGATGAYAEIPYGSYELKLFISSGSGINITRQLTEVPLYPNYDPCGSDPPQEGIWTVLRTYAPGGVYSLVVTPNLLRYFACNSNNTSAVGVVLNTYHVTTELNPPTNINYARMQGVNALQTGPVSFQVDGQPLGSGLGLGQPTDYGIFVQGPHQISVTDASGKVLAQKSITLYPFDCYTLWAYPDPGGAPDIAFANCNMTGNVYDSTYANGQAGQEDNGTDGALRILNVPYAWQSRFLNLAPDLPYATFTNDSTLFTDMEVSGDATYGYYPSCINLSPGLLPADNPYVLYSLLKWPPSADPLSQGLTGGLRLPALIRAYQSSPGPEIEIPGNLLTGVNALSVQQGFVANPALYSPGFLPGGEPGAYTTALIGQVGAAPGSALHARLIVIKHNK